MSSDHANEECTGADLEQAASAAAWGPVTAALGPRAWGLARALCSDRNRALEVSAAGVADAVADRGRLPVAGGAATLALSSVYRRALDQVRAQGTVAAPAPDSTVIEAFLALPERWRAALWLHAVDGADQAALAATLGVTAAGAGRLVERATASLELRLADQGAERPEALGPALAALAGPVPGEFGAAVAAVATTPAGRTRPRSVLVGRLGERTQRSLAVAAGTVLALGIVGIGVLSQHPLGGTSSVAAQGGPGASGTILVAPAASRSQVAGSTVAAPGGLAALFGGAGGAGGTGGTAGAGSGSGASTAAGSGAAAGGGAGGTTNGGGSSSGGSSSGGTTTAGSTPSGGSTSGGSTSGGTTSPTTAAGSTTTPTTTAKAAATTTTTTKVSLGPVSVSSGGSTTSISVGLPGVPVVGVTTCVNGILINILGQKVGTCPTTSTTSPGSTTTTTSLLGLGL